jgi:phage FluMu protein Com
MKKCANCGEFISDDSIQCKGCLVYLDGVDRVDERCDCGSLVAKLTDKTIEIKCRRCKRIRTIYVDSLPEYYNQLKEQYSRHKQGSRNGNLPMDVRYGKL